ncbi:MAG: LysM domain-containing protein [Christensenellaceae bacterium]|jgi:hypothetical protein|nr:LysM domain-containing protein [Christensenellaceae bacterium]
MQFANCTHTIQAGDTLYSLAIKYDTTVAKLLDLNPGVEIYNLKIGSTLFVCPPVVTPVPPIGVIPPVPPIGVVPTCPDKFREVISLILCWIAEQFGEDRARDIIDRIYTDWQSGYPC